MVATLLALLLVAAPEPQPDTLVVCPDSFRAALGPWLESRTHDGHRIAVVSNQLSATALRAEIRRRAKGGALEYVMLVGDAEPTMDADAGVRARCVPTHQEPSKVTVRFGSEPTIGTDNWYADLDDDSIPDLAIGRLTADSPEQLRAIVAKILAYDNSTDFGPWRRKVNLLAGIGGFGPLVDGAIEAAARRVIAGGVPPAYATRITYGNWRSPYCPSPVDLRATALETLNEGSLCWIYIGHAWPHRLADMHVPGAAFASLGREDLAEVRSRHGAPIACLLSCYTGAFDLPQDCLAEAMLATPGAPVAVLSGSRVTMPYAMSVLGCELMDEFFRGDAPTLGLALLRAKRQMAAPEERSTTRQGLDSLAELLNPGDTQAELVEHLQLFNLIGDPTLRLRLPAEMPLEVAERAAPGEWLEISGRAPLAGRASFELLPRRDRLGFRPPERKQFHATAAGLAEFSETYRRANQPQWIQHSQQVAAGPFTVRVRVPGDAEGTCHVRVFLEGTAGCAAGAADLVIQAPAKPARN